MKSDVLVSLIKEVVKSEVKRQVKEEVIKLIKSGDITLNGNRKTEVISKPKKSLAEVMDVATSTTKKYVDNTPKQPIKQIVKDPLLNEILNSTTPFTSAQRSDTAGIMGGGGSILDALQPSVSMEGDWETMDYRSIDMPEMQVQPQITDNPAVDSLTKALTRDYRELVKRFK